ncbi:LuxR family transcriptional regulator [Kutzneria sp. NPDC051319]|uniref:helix-turn-helix transcriptional regulator n=1 Tax=Kutzneria sp. NPDC051319 TaxID=3155047 RepID=UPI0034288D78
MPSANGRDAELSALDSTLAGIGPRRRVLAVVRGPRGIGKSALLAAFGRRTSSARVLTVAFRDGVPAWDEFGATALLHAAQRHFEEFAEPGVAASIEAVRALTQPLTYRSPQGRSGLVAELARLFGRLSRHKDVVVLADDVDALTSPASALFAMCLPRCLVVATCTDDGSLCGLADHVVNLGPLPAECVEPLLAKAFGAPFDESTLGRLLAALGPLGRHPATLLSTVDELRREGRLVVVHGRACMADLPIMVPVGHEAVARVRGFGVVGVHLVAMATSVRFGVDDLPMLVAAVGGTVAEYGDAVDELVRLKVLDCAADGQLTCPSPALAARVLAEAAEAISDMHAAVAQHLNGDEAVIAEHLSRSSLRHDNLLIRPAERAADEDTAARWLLAARPRPITAEFARLLTRTGHVEALLDLAADAPLDADAAAAVTVAAIHACRPVPHAVRSVLPAAAAFSDRWLADEPLRPSDLTSWCGPLSQAQRAELAEAAAVQDVAAMLDVVHGWGAPDSVPSLYHCVLRGYRTGDWTAVLAAARRLELAGAQAPIARLLAAEVCAEQGDERQALSWLAAAGARQPVLRAWVECGMRLRAGDHAFDLGWRAYLDAPTAPGHEQLLMRLVVIAVLADDPVRAVLVLGEIESRCLAPELLIFARGAVNRDLDRLRNTADLFRRRGHLPALLTVCLLAGGLAAEPQPWLHEAHELATVLGATPLRARARDLMRLRGVTAPRSTDRPSTLSKTELLIASLIRQGRTNRQIAVTMRMSEKTVEHNLSRVFAKTGARTRVDVAAAMVKRRRRVTT